MSTGTAKQEAREWLESWYMVGDKCVPVNSMKWFATNAVAQFNNMQPAHGKQDIQKHFESMIPHIGWMKHRIIDVDVVGNRIYSESEVTIVAAGDPDAVEFKLHRMNYYERVPKGESEEGQIIVWKAYYDPSPFMNRVQGIV